MGKNPTNLNWWVVAGFLNEPLQQYGYIPGFFHKPCFFFGGDPHITNQPVKVGMFQGEVLITALNCEGLEDWDGLQLSQAWLNISSMSQNASQNSCSPRQSSSE